MKKYLLALIFITLSLLYAGNWTLLVYMAADNNLATDASRNIRQMENAVQPEGLNIVVQVDLPGSGAKRYLVKQSTSQGGGSVLLQNLGNINSGSKDALKDFITWGRAKYPADNYMLALWGHGNSWYKGSKWIAPDDDSQSVIFVSNGELRHALAATGKWEILLFDACLMQSIEVISEIHDCADYIIGSVDMVPNTGFPYELIIPQMQGSPQALAEAIPPLYVDSYRGGGYFNDFASDLAVNCSSISTALYEDFFLEFKRFCKGIRPSAPNWAFIRPQLRHILGSNGVDLKEFLTALDAAGYDASHTLLDLWQEMIICEAFSGDDIATVSASLWFPRYRFIFAAELSTFLNLSFASSGWSSVVNYCLGEPYLPLERPELLSQRQILRKLQLSIKRPLSPDSLFYWVETENDLFFFYPPAYEQNPILTFEIEGSGSYMLFAEDQCGGVSKPLYGTYQLDETLVPPLYLYPNPVKDKMAARLFWAKAAEARLQVEIFNLRGQSLLKKAFDGNLPDNTLYLMDIEGFNLLKRGNYLVRLNLDGRKYTRKFTIL